MDKKPTPKKASGKVWKLSATVAIVVILGGGVAWYVCQPKTPPVTYETMTVEPTSISKVVEASGKVNPNFEVEIKAKSSGKIIKLPYDVSDYVQKGALLAQLDGIDENRAVAQSQATYQGSIAKTSQASENLLLARRTLSTDLARARADLAAAKVKQVQNTTQRNRLKQLASSRYISQQEYETGIATAAQSDTDVSNAQTRFRELQNQQISIAASAAAVSASAADTRNQGVGLAIAEQKLSETKVYAPIAGVVTSRTGQIGQIVASGISNVSGGTSILTLADMSRIFVLATVDESDIGQVQTGQPVKITVDAFPNKTFKGRVIRVAPKGVEDSNVVTFEVKIEVDDKDKGLLRSEMTTNVDILVGNHDNVLTVPVEAVITKNGQSFVRVLDSTDPQARPHRMPVELGLNNGTDVEITDGLIPGVKVVTSMGDVQSKWKKRKGGDGGPPGDGPPPGGPGGGAGGGMMMRGMMRR